MLVVLLVLVRVVLLVCLIVAGFVGYGHLLDYLFGLSFPPGALSRELAFGMLMAQGFVAAMVVGGLMSYPLAWLAGRYAVWAAIAATAPVLAFRIPPFFEGTSSAASLAIQTYEIAAYVTLLVVGTWLARRRLLARLEGQVASDDRIEPGEGEYGRH